jgi:hypothetical protein
MWPAAWKGTAISRTAMFVPPAGSLSVQKYLEEIGIEGGVWRWSTCPPGMGYRFAQVATEITEKIRQMGPSPIHVALAGGVSEDPTGY